MGVQWAWYVTLFVGLVVVPISLIFVPPLAAVYQPSKLYPVRVGVGKVTVVAPSYVEEVGVTDPPLGFHVIVQGLTVIVLVGFTVEVRDEYPLG